MRCVIVTGMSGAGKSTALKMLEDMGYFLCGQSSGTADSEDGRTVKRAGDGDQQGCSWSRYPEWTEFL